VPGAPRHRTLFALVAGLPEEKIRIITRDIGGGFGNKVPIYPGYVLATVECCSSAGR
jgi:carbon-monoxide dehydrogenase large subunit